MPDFAPKYKLNKEDSVGFLLHRAGRMIDSRMRENLTNAGLNLPHEQWVVLFLLWEQDGRNQSEIADLLFKDKGTITRGLISLEHLNLVVRIVDEADKRNKKVYLTQKGKELQNIIVPIALTTRADATEGIPEADLQLCKQVLIRIYENLKNI